MATPQLKARPRAEAEHGSRACLKLRRSGEIPASLYKVTRGEKTQLENVDLAVSAYDMYQLIAKQARILDVTFDGRTELVRVAEVQRDQFGDDVLHIDLKVLDPAVAVEVTVPLTFVGRPTDVTDARLVSISSRRVNLRCKPREIPETISFDMSKLTYGGSLKSGDLDMPAGVEPVDPTDELVVISNKPGSKKAEDENNEEAAAE